MITLPQSVNIRTDVKFGLSQCLSGKEPTCSPGAIGDRGSVSWSGRSAGEGNGNPCQYSCLGNAMDRGAWQATVHGVTESDMTEHTIQKLRDPKI